MVFLGLISFFDPPKNSAKQALWQLAEKGVKAKVLTGDSLSLAIKVCKEVGIRTTHVTTGPDLDILEHTEFHEAVRRATVLARLTPTQKLRVVQSLQKVGNHVVGFLGDGINDSLALEAADVGISVDSGASVAKDLADIILLEKDLNVLVSGVEHELINQNKSTVTREAEQPKPHKTKAEYRKGMALYLTCMIRLPAAEANLRVLLHLRHVVVLIWQRFCLGGSRVVIRVGMYRSVQKSARKKMSFRLPRPQGAAALASAGRIHGGGRYS
ncbi:hypothetical protein BHE74_00017463 [Ensete ventricosum]|uniref:Uncharacterized protein n=1 Tax=Ensete ventricosum TaxID=4639 RepID=A0A427B1K4_ENSVE|nr:hypothetical protein B296_00001311 [Ensete ventricosum]RWW25827.1 hypothetical protein GW17_00009815 [Ensete ventricosum]RWW74592.1 hypothetical protein BHE74_00017463 [Ensete ventricosum]RZR76084.1 hypothetical protein BHM03_00000706 [Ensete ventricosum]